MPNLWRSAANPLPPSHYAGSRFPGLHAEDQDPPLVRRHSQHEEHVRRGTTHEIRMALVSTSSARDSRLDASTTPQTRRSLTAKIALVIPPFLMAKLHFGDFRLRLYMNHSCSTVGKIKRFVQASPGSATSFLLLSTVIVEFSPLSHFLWRLAPRHK